MNGSSDYREFIASRRPAVLQHGIEPPEHLCQALLPHQRDSVKFALRAGRAALFHDTGLGKSFCALEWARIVAAHTGRPVVILTPLAVAPQFVREGQRFGIEARHAREAHEIGPGVNVANYERLSHFEAIDFGGVVLDECFAAGTKIDVLDQGGTVSQKNIENVRVGDMILNASGIDAVSDIHRREVAYAVKVKVGGSFCIASPNHPFFTQRGWVGARDLRPGDYALGAAAALRLVREGVCTSPGVGLGEAVLRDILLSEMADAPTGNSGEGSCAGSSGEARGQEISLVQVWNARSGSRVGARSSSEPDDQSGGQGKALPHIEGDGPSSFRAWGQWDWAHGRAGRHEGCSWRRMGSGVCFVTGPTDSRLSDALQDRLGASREANCHRGGWSLAPEPEVAGREEGSEADFARVDGIEVLELGHPELEPLRSPDGKLYFYDLGGTRHPSFSVNGILVHNSSILKSFAGKMRQALTARFSATPFRLCCTATPAPNDYMELGNHAEFLGVMPGSEMLTRWFINDTMNFGTYRLKGHAVSDFWDWVCSWARCLSNPADLGFDGAAYVLPELREIPQQVESDLTVNAGDSLFRMAGVSATNMHAEQRLSLAARVRRIAWLVAAEPAEPWLIWCETDEQADALCAAIPEAVEVRGSHPAAWKEDRLLAFVDGRARVLVTKPKLAGFGLNFQHCARMAFVALTFSYEAYYQAVRRCWRFGQTRSVLAHLVTSEGEAAIFATVRRKAEQHDAMKADMRAAVRRAQAKEHEMKRRYVAMHRAPLPAWIRSAA